jgi:hypothetical protein
MTRAARSFICLLVGAFLAVGTGLGSVAYASVPVPDPASDGFPPLAPMPAPVAAPASSLAQEIAWSATGAALVLIVVALVVGLRAVYRHRRTELPRLQLQ